MPVVRKTLRRMRKVRGELDPTKWYDTDRLTSAAGIGRGTLMDLRHSGKLKGKRLAGHGRVWYFAGDILGLMEEVE